MSAFSGRGARERVAVVDVDAGGDVDLVSLGVNDNCPFLELVSAMPTAFCNSSKVDVGAAWSLDSAAGES